MYWNMVAYLNRKYMLRSLHRLLSSPIADVLFLHRYCRFCHFVTTTTTTTTMMMMMMMMLMTMTMPMMMMMMMMMINISERPDQYFIKMTMTKSEAKHTRQQQTTEKFLQQPGTAGLSISILLFYFAIFAIFVVFLSLFFSQPCHTIRLSLFNFDTYIVVTVVVVGRLSFICPTFLISLFALLCFAYSILR